MEEISKEERTTLNINQGPLTENEIIVKNKQNNKDKIKIFSFLSNLTRIEIVFNTFQNYLYWIGLLEYFLWIVLLSLFISDTKDMKKIWFFLYHIPRATIGIIILNLLPKTHQAIERIDNFDSNNLEEIQNNLKNEYMKIIITSERPLKVLFIIYFILTVISIIVDVLFFCVISPDFGTKGTESKFFALIVSVLCFIISDFIYFIFFSSFKYIFPPETIQAIYHALLGFFTQLKAGIANGFNTIARKFTKKNNNNEFKSSQEVNNNGNNVEPIQNV